MEKRKVLGCLVGAAFGDAMGGPTETRTTKQIEELFGGYVTEFFDAPEDVFARGNQAGRITDDFSMAHVTCQEIIKNKGVIDDEVAKNSLIEWSKNETYFEQFVGPTSRAGINALKNNTEVAKWPFVNDNLKASNGSAMKIGPISLFAKGNFDKAMSIVEIISKPTHFNNKSLSGACAVAAAVNQALKNDSNMDDVYLAALKGAEYGEKRGHQLAGPSVYKRLKLAASIAATTKDMSECLKMSADILGNNASAYETVPSAFSLLLAARDNPLEAIYAAVNIGNDTDSIATIVGAIVGALYGVEIFDQNVIELINEVNDYDLNLLAEQIIENS